MSRSGYSDDCDGSELNLWRGAVESAIRGKRGQAFLRETLTTLEAMPAKQLTVDSLQDPVDGQFCTLGAVGAARGMDLKLLEYAEPETIGKAFGISRALAAEIMYENDEESSTWRNSHTPELRWSYMRNWVASKIIKAQP